MHVIKDIKGRKAHSALCTALGMEDELSATQQFENGYRSASVPAHEVMDRGVESFKGEFEHGKNLADYPYCPGHGPETHRRWIEPDSVSEQFGEKVHLIHAGSSAALINVDRSIGGHKLVRRHAGVAHNDDPGFGIPGAEIRYTLGFVPFVGRLPRRNRRWCCENRMFLDP